MRSLKTEIGSVMSVVLLIAAFPTALSPQGATGRFEVYCDSFGFLLEKIDGAPAPGGFFSFLYSGFPARRRGVGCFCLSKGVQRCRQLRSVATGKLWLDAERRPGGAPVSGK